MPYIFVTTDRYDENGFTVKAEKVLEERLLSRVWPLYERTPNAKTLKSGDKVLIYIRQRPKGGSIIASAEVQELIVNPLASDFDFTADERIIKLVMLDNIKRLPKPITFSAILPDLEICPKNMQKWGAILMGGVRKISYDDYSKIINIAENI